MKKIEAVIPGGRVDRAFEALKELNLGGVTYYNSKGRGQVPRPEVHSGRGTGTYRPEFNDNATLEIVLKEAMVNKVIEKCVLVFNVERQYAVKESRHVVEIIFAYFLATVAVAHK